MQAWDASAAFARRKKAAEKVAAALRSAAEADERSVAAAKEEVERNNGRLRKLRSENKMAEDVESSRLERLERALESSAERGRAAEEARKVIAAALADEARKVRFFFRDFSFERKGEALPFLSLFSHTTPQSLFISFFLMTDRGHAPRGPASAEGGS